MADDKDEGGTVFSSHPTANFKMGGFQFVKGTLRVADADLERFRALLDAMPVYIKGGIREISVDAADRIAASFKEGKMHQGVDTTANSIEAAAAFDGHHLTHEDVGRDAARPDVTEKPKFSIGGHGK